MSEKISIERFMVEIAVEHHCHLEVNKELTPFETSRIAREWNYQAVSDEIVGDIIWRRKVARDIQTAKTRDSLELMSVSYGEYNNTEGRAGDLFLQFCNKVHRFYGSAETCTTEGCALKLYKKDLCYKHYYMGLRSINSLTPRQLKRFLKSEELKAQKIKKDFDSLNISCDMYESID